MATEILVNDGGAPARIIPFVAVEAITAGDALGLTAEGSGNASKVNQLTDSELMGIMVGVALTDAAADEVCNVVSGRGVIVRINTTNGAGGDGLMASGTAGRLDTWVAHATNENAARPCAVIVDDPTGVGLTKCMIL